MINQQAMTSRWHEVATKLRQRWPSLTADDIHAFSGNVDEMIAKIAHLTGEQPLVVRQVVEEALGIMASVRATTADVASRVTASAREGYETVRSEGQRTVQEHPAETTLAVFGAGMLAGLGVALLFRQPPRPTRVDRVRTFSSDLANRITNAIADLSPDELRNYLRH